MDRDILQIVRQVCDVFEEIGIPYILGGSVAASPFGLSRLTKDIDIAARIRAEHVEPLVNAFEPEYYIVAESIQDAIVHRDMFNLIHLEKVWKVDIFVLGDDDWSQNQLRRRSKRRISEDEDSPEPFTTSLEDIVLQKIKWLHEGHGISNQQRQDIQLLLRRNTDRLDSLYMREWASHLGVSDGLNEALNEAGITGRDDK
jgi:hypothetical protein